MDDTPLNLGLRKDGMDGLFEASQPIDTGDEDVLNPTSLKVSDDTEPKVSPFGTITKPVAEYVSVE
jgi:hypothetical protein